tara:strand:+ start:465 stop:1319 length:855 start_codon:yes stop_codon:yes gene_type:complete
MAKFKKPSFTFPTLLESKGKRSVSPVQKSFKSGYHAGGSAVHSPQETAKMQAEQMFKAQTGQMAAQPATQTPQVAIDPSKQTQRRRPTTIGMQQARRVRPTQASQQMMQQAYGRVMEQMVDRSKPLTESEQAQVQEGAKNPNFFDDTPPPGETIDTSNRDVRRARTRRNMMMEQASRRRRPPRGFSPLSQVGTPRPPIRRRPDSPFPTTLPTQRGRGGLRRKARNFRQALGFGGRRQPRQFTSQAAPQSRPTRGFAPQSAPPSFRPPRRRQPSRQRARGFRQMS